MKKEYIIFDLDWTLINSHNDLKNNILNYFKENLSEYYDTARYKIDFNKHSNIWEFLEDVIWEINQNIIDDIYSYLDKCKSDQDFIDWTIEKIIELKDKYKLYLSTWSSTNAAEKILKNWWIEKYFEIIQWSEIIPKSEEHIDIFINHSQDNNFHKKAISIWDSPRDELFAKSKNINFIYIGKKYKSIKDIEII